MHNTTDPGERFQSNGMEAGQAKSTFYHKQMEK